jgi:hypothetical protein
MNTDVEWSKERMIVSVEYVSPCSDADLHVDAVKLVTAAHAKMKEPRGTVLSFVLAFTFFTLSFLGPDFLTM